MKYLLITFLRPGQVVLNWKLLHRNETTHLSPSISGYVFSEKIPFHIGRIWTNCLLRMSSALHLQKFWKLELPDTNKMPFADYTFLLNYYIPRMRFLKRHF